MVEVPWPEHVWQRLARQVQRAAGGQYAQDHLHNALISLLGRKRSEPVRNPEAFLVRSAINSAHNERRVARRHVEERLEDVPIQALAELAPGPEQILIARERLVQIRTAIAALTPRTREVFLLHRLEGLKYREIAARLCISESAIEKHIAKAAQALARCSREW